jgi:hypothetical protein
MLPCFERLNYSSIKLQQIVEPFQGSLFVHQFVTVGFTYGYYG